MKVHTWYVHKSMMTRVHTWYVHKSKMTMLWCMTWMFQAAGESRAGTPTQCWGPVCWPRCKRFFGDPDSGLSKNVEHSQQHEVDLKPSQSGSLYADRPPGGKAHASTIMKLTFSRSLPQCAHKQRGIQLYCTIKYGGVVGLKELVMSRWDITASRHKQKFSKTRAQLLLVKRMWRYI